MRKFFSIVFFSVFFSVFPPDAADVDTVSVFSRVMNRDIKTVIIKPQGYDSGKRYPTLYLLHGYSDDYSGWVRKAPVVKRLSDLYEMIIVCPDGGYNSWYWDSPVVEGVRFETFVSDELVSWVDGNLRTIARREGRAITGLSMGGHGALYLAFRHQDVYGACGSLSGGVDIRPFPNNWDIARLLGLRSEYPERWERHTVMGLLHLLTPGGVEDYSGLRYGGFFLRCECSVARSASFAEHTARFCFASGGSQLGLLGKCDSVSGSFLRQLFCVGRRVGRLIWRAVRVVCGMKKGAACVRCALFRLGVFFWRVQSSRSRSKSSFHGSPCLLSCSMKGSGSNSSTLNTPGFFQIFCINIMAPMVAGTPVV